MNIKEKHDMCSEIVGRIQRLVPQTEYINRKGCPIIGYDPRSRVYLGDVEDVIIRWLRE